MRHRPGSRSPLGRRLAVLVACLAAALFVVGPSAASAAGPVLHVNMRGDGEGTVVQDYGFEHALSDIDCTYHPGLPTGVCQTEIDTTSEVPWDIELHASPFAGSAFLGWSVPHRWILHGCGDSPTCHLDLSEAAPDEHVDVFAYFQEKPATYPLEVLKQGSGGGTVSSVPAGISCGIDCIESFDEGSVVTLTATADSTSTFSGWGGACEGSGSSPVCLVTMNAAKSVTARFTTQVFPLSVAFSGNGTGGVTSNLSPAISCPPNCTTNVGIGTQVTLYARAAAGSEFDSWTGVCASAGSSPICTFAMPATAVAVTAEFDRVPVDASLSWVTTGYYGPTGRATRFGVFAGERVTVRASIVRGGTVLASRQFVIRVAGGRTLQLNIPAGVTSGKARLKLTLVNRYGTQRTTGSKITIPPL